jgi:hypothetical protein
MAAEDAFDPQAGGNLRLQPLGIGASLFRAPQQYRSSAASRHR